MDLKESTRLLRTNVKGQDNLLEMENEAVDCNLDIKIEGNNNRIIVGNGVLLKKLVIKIEGSNNIINIGNYCRIVGNITVKGESLKVSIGEKTVIRGANLLARDNKDITIGRHCLFSTGIKFRTSDSHVMIDQATNEIINEADHINIGDYVWLGVDVIILKGSSVPNHCIVGAKSVVTKKFKEQNCAIAGVPAKIVKTGVTWSRK